MATLGRRATLGGAIASVATGARAAGWPDRPLTWVVPFPGGGPSDVFARPVAAQIAGPLGQTIVIDNRGGATHDRRPPGRAGAGRRLHDDRRFHRSFLRTAGLSQGRLRAGARLRADHRLRPRAVGAGDQSRAARCKNAEGVHRHRACQAGFDRDRLARPRYRAASRHRQFPAARGRRATRVPYRGDAGPPCRTCWAAMSRRPSLRSARW